ncbi:MAG: HAMP domain-containing histidine kinase [Lachnospiraceae bacterium]|jgi:signal transduction histidine kinase|nr:HAMP domain-containing histidine kinase [Lachnospiraceae bacterium]
MIFFLCLMAIGFAILSGVLYLRTTWILKKLDQMIAMAIDGDFVETEYNETMLSRLETRMYQYLSLNRQNQREIAKERDRVQMLISDISHQTKTPVANMLLYTQLLQENISSNKQALEFAQQIEQQTEKLRFLIQALVKTSQLENGIVAVVPKIHSVSELLEQLSWPAEAAKKGIYCGIEGEIPKVTACFDQKWTLEALSNLIDNAVKYTPDGGSVLVSVTDNTAFVRIDVKDTGIGISEEDTARIFTRFYRASQVQSEPGIGLGLYLVREILQREGGYIKVSSILGKGSVFSLFLIKNLSKL